MEITPEQYEKIKDSLPLQRGECASDEPANPERDPVCGRAGDANGAGLPSAVWRIGIRSTYAGMNRWAKNGVLDRVFERLHREQIVRISVLKPSPWTRLR